MGNKKLKWVIGIIAGLALLFAGSLLLKNQTEIFKLPTVSPTFKLSTLRPGTPTLQPTEKQVLVTRVIDGDTIELEDGTRVRLLGIDTPELGQCASQEAADATSKLVLNKNVRLETDVQLQDKYGRTLAHVFVNGKQVNEELVKMGWATTLTIPPNVKYVDQLLIAQQEAREAKLGIWANDPCLSNLSTPSNPSSDCTIKGNISTSGEKIYHVPGQRYYEKTKIEENRGERWFCSEDEAQTAGWRKSKV